MTEYKHRVFRKELHDGISNLTVWRVLRKSLRLKAFKLSIIQDVELGVFFYIMTVLNTVYVL
jgi:hypothetical protein